MAERAIRKERNVWMGSDTESAKQMLLRARNTHAEAVHGDLRRTRDAGAVQEEGGVRRPLFASSEC